MIYIAGDTHIPMDIKKLNTKNFPEQRELTENDYVIVCGGFADIIVLTKLLIIIITVLDAYIYASTKKYIP